MGQAKNRGTREERIAQATNKRVKPIPGLYVSTKLPLGMRFIVEDVIDADEPEFPDFFLVQLIDEASAEDPEAMGDELDPDQWYEISDRYGLKFQP
jgi:hypothetical protein